MGLSRTKNARHGRMPEMGEMPDREATWEAAHMIDNLTPVTYLHRYPSDSGVSPQGFPHGGGMAAGGGSDLNYIDDDLDSYEPSGRAITDTDDADHRASSRHSKNQRGRPVGRNVDLLCKYMAVQTFVVNLDSLSGNMAHNYYLYEKDGSSPCRGIITWPSAAL